MGRRGLGLVRRLFTWARGAEQMLSVYRWLLAEGTLPGCMFDSAPRNGGPPSQTIEQGLIAREGEGNDGS